MSLPKLKSILGKRNEVSALISSFVEKTGEALAIEDPEGNLLLGTEKGQSHREAVNCEGHVIGWVNGGESAGLVAGMLSLLAQKELEKKKLGNEVLAIYQELNIIFDFSEKLAQSIEPEVIAQYALEQARHSIPCDSGVVVLWDEKTERLQIPASTGEDMFDARMLNSNAELLLKIGLSGHSEIMHDLSSLKASGILRPGVNSLLYAALKVKNRIMGAIILVSTEPDKYTAINLKLLVTLALQSSTAIENALLYERNISEVKEREEAILRIHEVTKKFVPSEFISSLGKKTIADVKLGDQIQKEVTVLFTDIRDFTTLSEKMTPEENFLFVSSFNSKMGPVIREHKGFINQYLGDSIMAIFPDDPRDALLAAVSMQQELHKYNRFRREEGLPPIKIGIGMHTGPLIMGITGDEFRLDAATISDTVNTAARIEGLTKYFRTSILLSEDTFDRIGEKAEMHYRYLGKVQLKGKHRALGIHECFSGYEEEVMLSRQHSQDLFRQGVQEYLHGSFAKAIEAFHAICEIDPEDHTAMFFLDHARRYLEKGTPANWSGALEMAGK
jgi:class 3 adenylate cyclase